MICDRCIFKGRTDRCNPANLMQALMEDNCHNHRKSMFYYQFFQSHPDEDFENLKEAYNAAIEEWRDAGEAPMKRAERHLKRILG